MLALKYSVSYAISIALALMLIYTAAPGVAGYDIKECLINGAWTIVPPGKMCCLGGTLELKGNKDCCYGSDSNYVYYPRYSICCEGRVMSRYIEESSRRVERTCCNNKAVVLNETIQCCGGQLINKHDTLCCRDEDNPSHATIHKSGPNFGCCGLQVIDTRLQQCYRMNGTEVAVYRQQQVCGGQVINLHTHKCCFNRVHDVPHLNPHNIGELNPAVGCCGQTIYNTTRQQCCLSSSLVGTVVDRDNKHQACCGRGSVDTRHQLCCMGQAVVKTSPQDKCCGPRAYNTHTQSCCGNTPFNTLTHYCCSGSPSQPIRKGQDCCGGFPIGSHELCCFGTPVNKTSTQDDSCCRKDSTIRTYNSTIKSCNPYTGDIQTRISPLDDLCEFTPYLPDMAVCCGGQVHHFPPGDTLGCCRWGQKQTVYSETSQMCCQGHVHNISINEAECCQTQAYKLYSGHNPCLACTREDVLPPHQMCCANQTYHTWYDGDACCGHMPYFSQEDTCCNGQVRRGQQSCEHTPAPRVQNSSPSSYGFPLLTLMLTLMVVVRMVVMHSTYTSL